MKTDDRHLWEIDHPYYFDHDGDNPPFESWADFLDEFGDADMDYNLVFRWDWREGSGWDAGEYNGDDYYRHAVFIVGFVAQRKGFCWSRSIKVCRADEPAIKAWLGPRFAYLLSMWAPFIPCDTGAPEDASGVQTADREP